MTSQPTPGEVLNGESVRLLPCPFCGGKPHIRESMGETWVVCGSCDASSNSKGRASVAVDLWNRRPQPSGGQDGGGERTDAARLILVNLLEQTPGFKRDADTVAAAQPCMLHSWLALDAIKKALATPAKATGWPSREEVGWALRAYPYEKRFDWLGQADAVLALFSSPEDEGVA